MVFGGGVIALMVWCSGVCIQSQNIRDCTGILDTDFQTPFREEKVRNLRRFRSPDLCLTEFQIDAEERRQNITK